MDQENVSATLTVAVPAARVFAVPADPTTHSAIDGTGWVQETVDRAPLTEVGQIFLEYRSLRRPGCAAGTGWRGHRHMMDD